MTAPALPDKSHTSASPAETDTKADTTYDAFLGGQVYIRQPRKGRHRAGLDAVYLAAALPDNTTGHVVDLGSGVGTAGLCAAARLQDITVTLVDVDTTALSLARQNVADKENTEFGARLSVLEADITAKGHMRHSSGLVPGFADHAIINPPYYEADRFRASPDEARAGAHMLDERGLEPWVKTAADIVRQGGSLTMIFRADGLKDMLDVLQGRFGAIDIIPLHPRPGVAATRILLRGIKASKAPLQLLPGFVLHGDDGSHFTDHTSTILRDGKGLGLTCRR
ncbi:tRNA1(Val) (adenine(37)-N6)-methyltransferase [Roseibium algae]|uniref:Methyltransferase n=1 Tax=Roseibium algae TaxID=3123038 RepID=A0ABU8TMV4_9HYPH